MGAHQSPMSPAADSFARLVGILLPKGGRIIAIEAYFDESGTHSGSPVLCVAGYMLKSEQAIPMAEEWKAILDEYSLPFFRMVDCAHGAHHFKHLSKADRAQIAAKFIGLIRMRTMHGFAVLINPIDLDPKVGDWKALENHYTFALTRCAALVLGWANYTDALTNAVTKENILYIFESGHESASLSSLVMSKSLKNSEKAGEQRSQSFAFAGKTDAVILQAADLLAWQCFTYLRGKLEGRAVRKDFTALMQHPHNLCHLLTIPDEAGGRIIVNDDNTPHLHSPIRDEMLRAVYGKQEEGKPRRFVIPPGGYQ